MNNNDKSRNKLHVRSGDTVKVISGKDKGTVGTVKQASPSESKIVVEGVNLKTKAVKSNPMKGIKGGLVKTEFPIDSSRVMLYCSKCEKSTRIKHVELEGGAKTRVCKHCNEQLDV